MQIFADDIGTISVTGPIVRFDLMVQAIGEQSGGGKPALVVQQQVVMPIEAFLRGAMKMQRVVQDFEKRGIIKQATKVDSKGTISGKIGKGGEPLA